MSSTGALSLKQVPEKMIVIGAGVIGVELVNCLPTYLCLMLTYLFAHLLLTYIRCWIWLPSSWWFLCSLDSKHVKTRF